MRTILKLFFAATKETAYVQAITSAGVMYDLTRQCSSGFYNVCSCDGSKRGEKGEKVTSELIILELIILTKLLMYFSSVVNLHYTL